MTTCLAMSVWCCWTSDFGTLGGAAPLDTFGGAAPLGTLGSVPASGTLGGRAPCGWRGRRGGRSFGFHPRLGSGVVDRRVAGGAGGCGAVGVRGRSSTRRGLLVVTLMSWPFCDRLRVR